MALAFDKTNFYDTGMTVSGLGLTQSCTLGFWVKRASTDARCPIGNNPFRAGGTDSDVFTFFYVSGPWTRLNTASGQNTINSGTWGTGWTHLLTTYNGSKYRLFINGAYQAEASATGDIKNDGTRSWYIGRRGSYSEGTPDAWAWFGDIAEFAIWSAVLTDGEINSLGKGFSANRVRPQSLLTNSPLVRTLADARGKSTASGTVTAASHPAIYA
jgi:hypothetical protein